MPGGRDRRPGRRAGRSRSPSGSTRDCRRPAAGRAGSTPSDDAGRLVLVVAPPGRRRRVLAHPAARPARGLRAVARRPRPPTSRRSGTSFGAGPARLLAEQGATARRRAELDVLACGARGRHPGRPPAARPGRDTSPPPTRCRHDAAAPRSPRRCSTTRARRLPRRGRRRAAHRARAGARGWRAARRRPTAPVMVDLRATAATSTRARRRPVPHGRLVHQRCTRSRLDLGRRRPRPTRWPAAPAAGRGAQAVKEQLRARPRRRHRLRPAALPRTRRRAAALAAHADPADRLQLPRPVRRDWPAPRTGPPPPTASTLGDGRRPMPCRHALEINALHRGRRGRPAARRRPGPGRGERARPRRRCASCAERWYARAARRSPRTPPRPGAGGLTPSDFPLVDARPRPTSTTARSRSPDRSPTCCRSRRCRRACSSTPCSTSDGTDVYTSRLVLDLAGDARPGPVCAPRREALLRPAREPAQRRSGQRPSGDAVAGRPAARSPLPWRSRPDRAGRGRADGGARRTADADRPPVRPGHAAAAAVHRWCTLGRGRHRLVLTNHHILLDGWSMPLLVRRAARAVRRRAAQSPPRPARTATTWPGWPARTARPRLAAWRTRWPALDEPTRLAPGDRPARPADCPRPVVGRRCRRASRRPRSPLGPRARRSPSTRSCRRPGACCSAA